MSSTYGWLVEGTDTNSVSVLFSREKLMQTSRQKGDKKKTTTDPMVANVKVKLRARAARTERINFGEHFLFPFSVRVKGVQRRWRRHFPTFQRDLAKFFLSCSDTEAWILRSPLAPVILKQNGETK